jgi:signal transduction histidine kinase
VTLGDPSPDAISRRTDQDPAHETLPATEQVLSGFCHDLNGHLASALGFAYLLAPAGGSVGPLEHLRSSLDQIEELVRQLRGMVRDEGRSAAPASLAELLEAVGTLLRQHPRFPQATIDVDGPDDLPAVRIDFASGVRVLLLAIDSAVAGGPIARVEVGVEIGTDRVRLTLGPREPGVCGPAEPLVREARDAQVSVGQDPAGRVLWVELPQLT